MDHWRGVAVVLMVIYHLAWDVDRLGLYAIELGNLFWFIEGNVVRISFLLLVGVSLFISYQSSRAHDDAFSLFFKRQLKRSMIVFSSAMVIPAITFKLFPLDYIRFGILHLIAVGILLGALLIRRPLFALILGIVCLYAGLFVNMVTVDTFLLLPLGLTYTDFKSIDYFPIFPWTGFVFLGIALAHWIDHLNGFTRSTVNRNDPPRGFVSY